MRQQLATTNSLNGQEEHINSLNLQISYNEKDYLQETNYPNNIIKNGFINLYDGYEIYDYKFNIISELQELHIYLRPENSKIDLLCPECHNKVIKWGYEETNVIDAPQFNCPTHCHIKQQRIYCAKCNKTFVIKPSFVHPNKEITLNLYYFIKRSLETCDTNYITLEYTTGYSRESVRMLDRAFLAHENTKPVFTSTENITEGKDEHCFKRGKNMSL